MSFEKRALGNINLHLHRSDKFKTTALVVLIEQELSEEKVTKTALLPQVLERGTISYPTTLELKHQLNDMYGARLFGEAFKRGERHLIQFAFEIANEQYLKDQTPLLEKGISFLSEVLCQPVLEEGAFRADYVNAEKNVLKKKIESIKDDKIQYAMRRLNEEMCKKEPFSLLGYGRLADLDKITPQDLYTYYQEVLQTCPIDIYCVGNVDIEEVSSLLERKVLPYLGNQNRKQVTVTTHKRNIEEVKEIVDVMDVNQGKLNLGCRTQVTIEDEQYPALLLYNGILGGFAHSKLFMNVREKESLAYYCSSQLESYKGLLWIQSGVEIENYNKALSIIHAQLNEMKEGKITEEEIEKTKATITNQLREQQDSSFGMVHFAHHSVLTKRKRELDDLLNKISAVRREEIQSVAEKIELDTIYFLRNQGGDVDAKN